MSKLRRASIAALCALAAAWEAGCGSEAEATAGPPAREAGAADGPRLDSAGPDTGASCRPRTCAELGAECGTAPDACGGTVACGSCEAGVACGGGGPNLCGSESCVPLTCAKLSQSCGVISDHCAATIDCGDCTAPTTCGGGGIPNQCGCPLPTCANAGVQCGTFQHACGLLQCGACTAPDSCGGGGVPNVCACVPNTCGKQCGVLPNGCGGNLTCTCPSGQVCNGGACCTPSCSGADCGDSNGCGGTCSGSCPWSEYCDSEHECECGPSPNFKWISGTCKASCGKWLGHMGYANNQGGCCSAGCRTGVKGSNLNETWDCAYCCESFEGQPSCK